MEPMRADAGTLGAGPLPPPRLVQPLHSCQAGTAMVIARQGKERSQTPTPTCLYFSSSLLRPVLGFAAQKHAEVF